MIEVPLTQGRVALIDDDDAELIAEHKWHVAVRGKYAATDVDHVKVYMHRLIMQAPKGMDVDHIDGDGLNNQRANLRVCTHAENIRNSRRRCDNTSGFRGVWYSAKDRRWVAEIKADGRRRVLGYFRTPEEASRAYDEAAVLLHGDFARLNHAA